MKTLNTYRNPWQQGAKNGSPAIYTNNAPCILEHRGVRVFRLNERSFDFVLGDCAITQRAGASNAKTTIDGILDGLTHVSDTVAAHLASHGFKAATL